MEEYNVGETEEQLAEQQEAAEQYADDQDFGMDPNSGVDAGGLMGYSEPKPLGGLYALFSELLNRKDSIKTSNINPKTELGDLGISVRDAMRIALIANTFGHKKFASFFMNQAGIITDSAMSKEGWFPELFVTSKKQAYKTTAQAMNPQQQEKKPWQLIKK